MLRILLLLLLSCCLSLVTERIIPVHGGSSISIQEYFFETPVPQPRRESRRRVADLTGLKIWPTALPLLHYLSQHLSSSRQKIVELGAGCGTVGIGLATAGHEVLLTDPDLPVALSETEESTTCTLLQANVDRNPQLLERARVARLVWGSQDDAIKAKPLSLALASDCLYNPDYYQDLADTLIELSAPAIIGYQPRLPAQKEKTFFDLLRSDFHIEHSGPLPNSPCWVYHLQPKL